MNSEWGDRGLMSTSKLHREGASEQPQSIGALKSRGKEYLIRSN